MVDGPQPNRAPRPGKWFRAPKRVERVHDPGALRRDAICGLVGATGISLLVAIHPHFPPLFAAATSVAVVTALCRLPTLLLRYRGLRLLGPEDFAFRDHELGSGEHPVELVVMVDGVGLGTDRGIVSFGDGLLSFHGSATSFSLAAADFRMRSRFDVRDPYLWLPRDVLLLRTEGHTALIRLIELGDRRDDLTRDLAEFFYRARPVDGTRQWPPMERHRPQEAASLPSGKRSKTLRFLLDRLVEK